MQHHLTPKHYSILAALLHWLLAFALAFQMGLGWHMSGLQDASNSGMGLFAVTQLHKSIGISILLASLVRLILRIYKKPPTALKDDVWAHKLSQYTHISLYIFMIGTPLSGWFLVSSSEFYIDTYVFSTLYWPHIPGIETLSDNARLTLNMVSLYTHEILSWAGILLFFLHVLGALRHQYFKDEPILWRILPIAKPLERSYASLGIMIIAIALIGLFSFTQFIVDGFKPISIESDTLVKLEKSQSTQQTLPLKQTLPVDELAANRMETEEIGLIEDSLEAVKEQSEEESEEDSSAKKEEAKAEIIKPSDWTIVGAKSLAFAVKWNDENVQGSFSDWSADIRFSSTALEQSSIKVVVNLLSVITSDATVNSAIGGIDFFHSSAFPEAQYVSNSIKSIGDSRYQMDGTLQLKNIKQPLRIFFSLDENGNNASAKGSAAINRMEHGIGLNQSEIASQVRVTFDFKAQK